MLAALYAIAIFGLLAYGVNLSVLAVLHARADRQRPGTPPDDEHGAPRQGRQGRRSLRSRRRWPAVTVQLPLYNEAHVAERLIDACARLDYPRRRLEIQVLDDSTDETSERVARRVTAWQRRGLDVVHVRRTTRAGYKAGALQNGLHLARGELIALFDADFVPPPDFLRRTVPPFDDPQVGMVQARWGHLNAAASLLTRVQAFGLDAHFAIEQPARYRAGCFISFNGTAGLWRRRCIEEAGGWQADTLTEDLDLSYRAQLAGWRFCYLPEVEVPAELPVELSALRAQQFRWAKGGIETARKLLGALWRSGASPRVKLEGAAHLTAHLAFPLLLLAALTHAPLLWMARSGQGPGPAYFAVMALGLIGFAGFFLAQIFAQRALYPDWGRRLRLFPLFVAGTVGFSLSNTRAVWQALRGADTPFTRTAKYSGQKGGAPRTWWTSRYASAVVPPVVWGEALLALYSVAGLGVIVACGAWAAVPFQALFAAGFLLVAAVSLRQARRVGRAG